jgi:predicted Zn-dependent peptidase
MRISGDGQMVTATRQDSQLYTRNLDNGLTMIGQRIPGVESAASIFWVRTGTRDEIKAHMGVSHFLEHMAFRRTKNLAGPEVDRAFEEIGADHNAATWKEFTFYWVRVLSENTPRAIEILSELTHPVLDADDFDQERKVILEEIARYEDQPSSVLIEQFMHDYFGDNPLSWETLGTEETIKSLTVEQMTDYWRRRYGTRNMIFSIAGNFDWSEVVSQLEDLTQDWQAGETGRALVPATFHPGFSVYQRDQFVQQQLAIGVPSVPSKDERYFAAAILSTILGDDTGSRLYWALYHEGLADSASAQVMDFEDTGVLMVHVSTQPEAMQRALDTAQAELERLQGFDVQQDELDRAKAKLNSSVIIGGESTNDRVLGLINSWLTRGRLETLEELRRRIDAVELGDLRAYLDAYPVWPKQVISSVGPLDESEIRLQART